MQIHIPTPLRAYTGQQATVSVEAVTVQNGLEQLVATYPEMKRHLFNDDGKLRAFVNLYLNEDDVRYLTEKEYTAVKADDELSIIPSIAGGCWPHGRRAPLARKHARTMGRRATQNRNSQEAA